MENDLEIHSKMKTWSLSSGTRWRDKFRIRNEIIHWILFIYVI